MKSFVEGMFVCIKEIEWEGIAPPNDNERGGGGGGEGYRVRGEKIIR